MKILIWTHHPGDLLGEAIDFFTHGSAQHAGFLRANGMIHEAYLPRVRDRKPLAPELPFVKTFRLRGLPEVLEPVFEALFDRALDAAVGYSVEDLFRFLFNAPNVDEKHTFCSRYVMHTIMELCPPHLWPQVRCMDGDWVSPRDLFISPMLVPAGPLQLL
jgi:hypothetical protein